MISQFITLCSSKITFECTVPVFIAWLISIKMTLTVILVLCILNITYTDEI